MYKKYEIEAVVRACVAMYAEKGEKRTRKAWDKAVQTEIHDTKMVDTVRVKTVNLCLEALFARGDATFLDALFAEDDAAKLLDPEYRRSFLPENHLAMRGKQAQKWYKVDDAEHLLASWWAYLNTPFLQDILDNAVMDMVESKNYLDDADLYRETFLDEVRGTLALSNPPTFIDVLVDDMVETFTYNLDLEDFGYDCEGYEAMVWKQFMDTYGLDGIIKSEYKRELCEIAEEILDA